MARYAPHTNYFKKSETYSKAYSVTYFFILIFSLIATFFDFHTLQDYLGVVSIIVLAVLEWISNDYKTGAESLRRRDFMDNSFGTNFVHDSSDEYYDNDEVKTGIKKTMINLMENIYFSKNISEEMYRKKLAKNIIAIFIITSVSTYGFFNNLIAIPMLQIFLSRYFILDLINIYRFKNKLDASFNSLKTVSSNLKRNTQLNRHEVQFLNTLIEYEVLITDSNIKLDSKIFNQLNAELTNSWNETKKKYI